MVGAMNWFNFFEKFKMSNLGFKIITIIAALVYLSSCAKTVYAPAINFENNSHSYSPIKNVKVIWNGLRLIEESDLDVCRSSKHSIYLDEISSFFGPVHVEWENAKGEKFIKDFIFKKDDLPNIGKSKMPNEANYHGRYVRLYFDQNNFEYYTFDSPGILEIESTFNKRRDTICDSSGLYRWRDTKSRSLFYDARPNAAKAKKREMARKEHLHKLDSERSRIFAGKKIIGRTGAFPIFDLSDKEKKRVIEIDKERNEILNNRNNPFFIN